MVARLLLRAVRWGMFYRSLFPVTKPADLAQSVTAIKADLARPGRMVPLRAQLKEIQAQGP